MNVEVVTIGDELILGFTVDTNAAHLARVLAENGISVVRHTTVGDLEREIRIAVGESLSRTGRVITTGGLGPTSDDRSKFAIAELFGREMVMHEPTLEAVRARWQARGLGELPVTNRNQALIPKGADLLENRHGSAPGIWLERNAGEWLAMLPGVPREMRGMLADSLLPRLHRMKPQNATVIASRTLRTTGMPESRIADLVGTVPLPKALSLAYLPSWEGVDLRLTSRDQQRAHAEALLAGAAAAIRTPLSDIVYGENGVDLASIVLDTLRARSWTIAVAESCTGGMLGARLTAIPGSSDVVLGGIIAYADDVKRSHLGVRAETLARYGAVSEAVAREMAAGVRAAMGATVGVGITGVAGPAGGSEAKPVGTVVVAVDAAGTRSIKTAQHTGDRDEIRRRATQAALVMVKRAAEFPGQNF